MYSIEDNSKVEEYALSAFICQWICANKRRVHRRMCGCEWCKILPANARGIQIFTRKKAYLMTHNKKIFTEKIFEVKIIATGMIIEQKLVICYPLITIGCISLYESQKNLRFFETSAQFCCIDNPLVIPIF